MSCDRCNGVGLVEINPDRLCTCEVGQVRALCQAIDQHLPLIDGDDRTIEWWVARVAAAGAELQRRPQP